MELEGVVTNVTAFGAFVDVGVHQDGLVHVSQLADRFVKDPHEVVKVGDRIQVRVLEVDLGRQRIALSAKRGPLPASGEKPRPGGDATQRAPKPGGPPARPGGDRPAPQRSQNADAQKAGGQKAFTNNPFAALLGKGASPKR